MHSLYKYININEDGSWYMDLSSFLMNKSTIELIIKDLKSLIYLYGEEPLNLAAEGSFSVFLSLLVLETGFNGLRVKVEKDNTVDKHVFGYVENYTKDCIILDDIVNSGNTLKRVSSLLTSEGFDVVGAIALVDFYRPTRIVEVKSLYTLYNPYIITKNI